MTNQASQDVATGLVKTEEAAETCLQSVEFAEHARAVYEYSCAREEEEFMLSCQGIQAKDKDEGKGKGDGADMGDGNDKREGACVLTRAEDKRRKGLTNSERWATVQRLYPDVESLVMAVSAGGHDDVMREIEELEQKEI